MSTLALAIICCILRIADVGLTTYAVLVYGTHVELNPIWYYLLEHSIFGAMGLNLVISIAVVFVLYKFNVRRVLLGVNVFFLLVVINNIVQIFLGG